MKYGIHPYYKPKVLIHTNGSTYLNTIPTISTEAFNSLLHQKINILNNFSKENISNNLLKTHNLLQSKNLSTKIFHIKKENLEKFITEICTEYCVIASQEYKTARKYNIQKNITIFGMQKTKYLLQTQMFSNTSNKNIMDNIKMSDIIFFKHKKDVLFSQVLDVDTFSHSF